MKRRHVRPGPSALLLLGLLAASAVAAGSLAPVLSAQPPAEVATVAPATPGWILLTTYGLAVALSPVPPTASASALLPTVLGTGAADYSFAPVVSQELAERLTLALLQPPPATEFALTLVFTGAPSHDATVYLETSSVPSNTTLLLWDPLGSADASPSLGTVSLLVNVCSTPVLCP